MRAALLLVLLLLPGVPRAEARVLEVGCLPPPPPRPSRGMSSGSLPEPMRIAPCGAPTGSSSRGKISSVLLSATASAGKGVFVIPGNDVTVRGVTLTGARSERPRASQTALLRMH